MIAASEVSRRLYQSMADLMPGASATGGSGLQLPGGMPRTALSPSMLIIAAQVHFGKKGLDYMHRSLGKWEISDYSDAVKWLRNQPWARSPRRMGITGGSYGGYTDLHGSDTAGADYWTHGIADYSVTDWRLYDNVYTERFMDTPEDNPEGYKDGSVLTHAGKPEGQAAYPSR
ncbi:MAG: S9 family peptidase [Marinilabiliales bacterium]|nr:S9 family peptidase [Marinilabiliales bacterium]